MDLKQDLRGGAIAHLTKDILPHTKILATVHHPQGCAKNAGCDDLTTGFGKVGKQLEGVVVKLLAQESSVVSIEGKNLRRRFNKTGEAIASERKEDVVEVRKEAGVDVKLVGLA